MGVRHIWDGLVSGLAAVAALAICGVPFRVVWPRSGPGLLSPFWPLLASFWAWLLAAKPPLVLPRPLTGGADMHLAELNVGRLLAPTDDPRVAEFMAALDRINGLGKRMPGFVWMMEGSGEPGPRKSGVGNTEAKIAGDPQYVSNLTVWESVETLEAFVWNTVHRQFYERRAEWFQVLGQIFAG